MRARQLLFAAFLVAAACKGGDSDKPAGPGPLVYTTGDKALAGNYDGTKAIMTKTFGHPVIYVPKNCPGLTCAALAKGTWSNDKAKANCAKGYVVSMEVAKDLTAGSKQPLTEAGCVHGGSANGLITDGAKTNQVEVLSATPDTVTAKVSLDSSEGLNGVVAAKVCK